MRAARPRPTLGVASALALVLLTVALAGGPVAAEEPAGREDRVGRTVAAAHRALDRAEAALDGRSRVSATLALRDLTLRRADLAGTARLRADALLARPVTDQTRCTPTFCLHWDAADAAPDHVEAVAAAVGTVQQRYLDAGYRPVKPDGTAGGNPLPDIYLQDVGADRFYGYCNADRAPHGPGYDAAAFCVLDDDYAPEQFPFGTPMSNMQVTVAHEYFHAVQFAYDYLEDGWFMEATATWAEDELFDDVDDNVGYLASSPLSHPARSLDRFGDGHEYGGWVFFRHLTERYAAAEGGMPTLVRDMWRLADDAAGGPAQYSLQAVTSALAARGTSLAAAYAGFAVANRRPGQSYAEGAANRYPAAPLGRFARDRGWHTTRLDHLSSATRRYVPGSAARRLVVRVDLAPPRRGSLAALTVLRHSGAPRTVPIRLDADGEGRRAVGFDPATVAAVEVTLVNASGRSRCWSAPGSPYSCAGTPLDDRRPARVKATVRS